MCIHYTFYQAVNRGVCPLQVTHHIRSIRAWWHWFAGNCIRHMDNMGSTIVNSAIELRYMADIVSADKPNTLTQSHDKGSIAQREKLRTEIKCRRYVNRFSGMA